MGRVQVQRWMGILVLNCDGFLSFGNRSKRRFKIDFPKAVLAFQFSIFYNTPSSNLNSQATVTKAQAGGEIHRPFSCPLRLTPVPLSTARIASRPRRRPHPSNIRRTGGFCPALTPLWDACVLFTGTRGPRRRAGLLRSARARHGGRCTRAAISRRRRSRTACSTRRGPIGSRPDARWDSPDDAASS